MRAIVFRLPTLIILNICFAVGACGQNSQRPYAPPPVLARLERLQTHEDVCALVNRSGEYRLERRYAVKLEVFVGSLSPSQLQEFEQIIDTAELRNISRKDVPHPMIVDTVDQFLVDVYRTDGEQHLSFNSPNARKPFRAGTDPVLKWLERIQKAEHKRLTESRASHCMPDQINQDHPVLSSVVIPPPPVPYLMILATDHFRENKAERNSVIVYPDGHYCRENSTQAYGAQPRLQALEGSLNSTQLAELHTLLDAAELKNLKHEASCKLAFGEGDFTVLTVPRQFTVQRVTFDHCFNVLGNRDKPGGYSGMQYVVTPEERVLDPIREWLKTNLENQTLASRSASAPVSCDPDR
jgi:hypothetical protein